MIFRITLSLLFSCFGLSLSFAQSNRPQPACIPADQPNWPVQAIYLHGWFEANGSGMTHSRQTEFNNREVLERIARENHIRIALPIAPGVNSSNGMQSWSGTSLSNIERLSVNACGGAPLASDRSLMGFSNGGFAAKNIGQLPCDQLRQYRRVLAIGTQQQHADRCNGIFHNIPAHVFPPANLVEQSRITPSVGQPADLELLPFLDGSSAALF